MAGYSFGIEEEYFLTERSRGGVRAEMPPRFVKDLAKQLGREQVTHELLQSQIEVCTRPATASQEAREQLMAMRSLIAERGREHGFGIVAAGTHPLARWKEQRLTRKRRYDKLVADLQLVGLTNLLCGMHVHVEVPEPSRRVEIMYRMIPFLPPLLALSTSSPFWQGQVTGLLGYRNAVNDELPRTGLPELFRSGEEYETYVQTLVEAKIIKDSSYVWWAVRPSMRHPTLELRLTDCCTSLDDGLCIAALFRCLVRHLSEHPRVHADLMPLGRAFAEENTWRSQRYGINGSYIDIPSGESVPFATVIQGLQELIGDDAAALGCEADIAHIQRILKRGTSAHRQLAIYRAGRDAGRPRLEAIRDVVKWLRLSTELGDFADEPAGAAAGSGRASASNALT